MHHEEQYRDRLRTALIAAIFIIMALVFLDMLTGDPNDGGSFAAREN